MKRAGALVAAVAAAVSVAFSLPTQSHGIRISASSPRAQRGSSDAQPCQDSKGGSVDEEKFAPRFDGLRFIETLVTAHR